MTFGFDQGMCCRILPRFQEHCQIHPWMHAVKPKIRSWQIKHDSFSITILAASRYNSSVSSLVPSSVVLAASRYASDKARKPIKGIHALTSTPLCHKAAVSFVP